MQRELHDFNPIYYTPGQQFKAVWFYLGCQLHLVKQYLHSSGPHILCSTGWVYNKIVKKICCVLCSFIANQLSFLSTNLLSLVPRLYDFLKLEMKLNLATVNNCWHCLSVSNLYTSTVLVLYFHSCSFWSPLSIGFSSAFIVSCMVLSFGVFTL